MNHVSEIRTFGFRICFGFRYSKFGFFNNLWKGIQVNDLRIYITVGKRGQGDLWEETSGWKI
jgi:hypothetical protein